MQVYCLHLQCYFNTYLSQETKDGFLLFLVQPKDFACTTGLMGSYTLLLPPRSYALLIPDHTCLGKSALKKQKILYKVLAPSIITPI